MASGVELVWIGGRVGQVAPSLLGYRPMSPARGGFESPSVSEANIQAEWKSGQAVCAKPSRE